LLFIVMGWFIPMIMSINWNLWKSILWVMFGVPISFFVFTLLLPMATSSVVNISPAPKLGRWVYVIIAVIQLILPVAYILNSEFQAFNPMEKNLFLASYIAYAIVVVISIFFAYSHEKKLQTNTLSV